MKNVIASGSKSIDDGSGTNEYSPKILVAPVLGFGVLAAKRKNIRNIFDT